MKEQLRMCRKSETARRTLEFQARATTRQYFDRARLCVIRKFYVTVCGNALCDTVHRGAKQLDTDRRHKKRKQPSGKEKQLPGHRKRARSAQHPEHPSHGQMHPATMLGIKLDCWPCHARHEGPDHCKELQPVLCVGCHAMRKHIAVPT
jgi:hypothetical protein